MVTYKEFPTDFTLKANPTDSDILLIGDAADNNKMKKITIGSITADIGDGLIVDGSESAITTYSSSKINDLNDAQDVVIASLDTDKLEKNAQLRTGNGAWKTIYNNGSGNETELTLGAATKVFTSNGATSAPTWETPTVDIVSLTEDTTGDLANDFLLAYDASASANKKQKPQIYTASDAEVIAGTSTVKWVTPKQLKDNQSTDSVNFSRDVSTASGTQTVNHSLGRVPKGLSVFAIGVLDIDGTIVNRWAGGSYDGTDNKCATTDVGTGIPGNSDTLIEFADSNHSKGYAGSVTAWDSTTITITWTKTGSPTGTMYVNAFFK